MLASCFHVDIHVSQKSPCLESFHIIKLGIFVCQQTGEQNQHKISRTGYACVPYCQSRYFDCTCIYAILLMTVHVHVCIICMCVGIYFACLYVCMIISRWICFW